MSRFVTVARTDDIPDGEGRAFPVGDRVVAVFRRGNDFYAIDDACPHMGASLASGCLDQWQITCPWHAWRFDIRDGTWMDNPRVKIDSFPVRVVDQDVQVEVNDEP